MAEGEASAGRSDVSFAAEGRTYMLRPTLGAARGISRQFGGFVNCYSRIRAYDFDAMAAMIAHGLEKTDPDDREGIEQLVFDAGVRNLVEPLCAYIERLANRGQPLPAEKPKGGDSKKNAGRTRNISTGA